MLRQTLFPILNRIRITASRIFRPEQNRGTASVKKETTFPSFNPVPITQDDTGFSKQFQGDIYSSRGRFGNGTTFLEITAEHIQSSNFVTGSAGWQMTYDRDLEANSGTFRGDLVAGSIDIPDKTTANSFHVDSTGNAWWGATAIGSATAKVLNTGVGTFSNITVTGGTVSWSTVSGTTNAPDNNADVTGDYQGALDFTCQGNITIVGTVTTGTLTGVLIQTSASANTGVKISSSIGGIDVYGQSLDFYTTGGVLAGRCLAETGVPMQIVGISNDVLIGTSSSSYDAFVGGAATFSPNADDSIDLGKSNLEWKDLFIDGTAQVDALRIDQTPTAATPTPTHTITINCNGTVYRFPCVI